MDRLDVTTRDAFDIARINNASEKLVGDLVVSGYSVRHEVNGKLIIVYSRKDKNGEVEFAIGLRAFEDRDFSVSVEKTIGNAMLVFFALAKYYREVEKESKNELSAV